MTGLRKIEIASDFSKVPGGRFVKHGPDSGEQFRNQILKPALLEARRSGTPVVVVLDGVAGYAGSFLEEAFGGLVRKDGFSAQELEGLLDIRANDTRYFTYRDLALEYIRQAKPDVIH